MSFLDVLAGLVPPIHQSSNTTNSFFLHLILLDLSNGRSGNKLTQFLSAWKLDREIKCTDWKYLPFVSKDLEISLTGIWSNFSKL